MENVALPMNEHEGEILNELPRNEFTQIFSKIESFLEYFGRFLKSSFEDFSLLGLARSSKIAVNEIIRLILISPRNLRLEIISFIQKNRKILTSEGTDWENISFFFMLSRFQYEVLANGSISNENLIQNGFEILHKDQTNLKLYLKFLEEYRIKESDILKSSVKLFSMAST